MRRNPPGALRIREELDIPPVIGRKKPANLPYALDFEYVISGRVVLELDDGMTVELGPGDTVVQNATRHAWRNPFSESCRMLVVLIGAERVE